LCGYLFHINFKNKKLGETKDVLLLVHELDMCFGEERASISRLAEMRHLAWIDQCCFVQWSSKCLLSIIQ